MAPTRWLALDGHLGEDRQHADDHRSEHPDHPAAHLLQLMTELTNVGAKLGDVFTKVGERVVQSLVSPTRPLHAFMVGERLRRKCVDIEPIPSLLDPRGKTTEPQSSRRSQIPR